MCVRCLGDVIKFEIDYTGFVASSDRCRWTNLASCCVHMCQDTRWKGARRALQVATYLSLLDTFVAGFERYPFGPCVPFTKSLFALSLLLAFSYSPSLISIVSILSLSPLLPTHDPVFAIIAMGFLSTRIITGSSSRITL